MKSSSIRLSAADGAERTRPDNATVLATIKAHATTKTYAEIGALLGLSPNAVGHVAYAAGIKKPYVSGKLRAKQAYQREMIMAHAATHSLQEIGRMLGVTHEHVRQLCMKWQIERRGLRFSPLRWMNNRELRKLVRQPAKFFKEIAGEAGVSAETLTHELCRRGMKPFTRCEQRARLLKKGMRICGFCRRAKSLEQFCRKSNDPTGHSHRCLECMRAYANERQKRKSSSRG